MPDTAASPATASNPATRAVPFRIIPDSAYWALWRILHKAHIRRYFLRAGAAHPEALSDWCDAWTERIAVLYRAHHALAATMPGTDARQDAAGRWQRAFTDIDAHRILQASDAAKGLLHPAAAKVIATLNNEWDGLATPPWEVPEEMTRRRPASSGDCSRSMPSWPAATSALREVSITNTVVAAVTKVHSHHRWPS